MGVLVKRRFYVEAVTASLIDVSSASDLPEGTFVVGEQFVTLRTRAGSFDMAWTGEQPALGSVIEMEVTER